MLSFNISVVRMSPTIGYAPRAISQTSAHLLALAATLLGASLSLLLFRHGRLLTFDAYHYCELTKQFAEAWPDRFGNHWPFGYPLAGSLLVRAGVPGYLALVAVSLTAFYFLNLLTAHLLNNHPNRVWIVLTLAMTPIIGTELLGVLTELPFALALVGLVVSLAEWPSRRALWTSTAWAVVALSIRYAGVIALAALVTWLLIRIRLLRATNRLWEAFSATLAAGLVSSGLLFLNVVKSGHASGAERGNPPGLGALPAQIADFGWSAPSALVAGGVRDHFSLNAWPGVAIGWLIFSALTALCILAWFRPCSRFSRPLTLVALGYCFGMCVLRCVGDFDALYNARTFLPAIVPLAVLLAERLAQQRSAALLLCAALAGTGILAAVRGISHEIGGNVQLAVAVLKEHLKSTDNIAINDHAFTVSALVPQRTRRTWIGNWDKTSAERFMVISGEPLNRAGDTSAIDEIWRTWADRLVANGHCRYLLNQPTLVVIERIDR